MAASYFFPWLGMSPPSLCTRPTARSSVGSREPLVLDLFAHRQPFTSMPMDLAVPATWAMAPSRSIALRSGIFCSAISRTCAFDTEPTISRFGAIEPFSSPAALRSSTGVGGVFVMNVKLRSSKIVISAGITVPRCASVAALYCLQKSMMLMPCGPSAVPTGGAGVAAPAWIWILTIAATLLFAMPLRFRFLLGLELRDVAELELDRRLPAEDVHE